MDSKAPDSDFNWEDAERERFLDDALRELANIDPQTPRFEEAFASFAAHARDAFWVWGMENPAAARKLAASCAELPPLREKPLARKMAGVALLGAHCLEGEEPDPESLMQEALATWDEALGEFEDPRGKKAFLELMAALTAHAEAVGMERFKLPAPDPRRQIDWGSMPAKADIDRIGWQESLSIRSRLVG